MKQKKLLLFLSLVLANFANGQNYFFIGNKSYPSTESYELRKGLTTLNVKIAKNDEGGLLILSTESFSGEKLTGKIFVMLEDKTIITCIDRGLEDRVNNKNIKIYRLTKDEFYRLASYNIYSIRFTIKQHYSSENYIIKNYKDKDDPFIETIDFSTEVSKLN